MEVEPVQAKANLRGLGGIVFKGIKGGRIGVIKGLYRSYEGVIKGLKSLPHINKPPRNNK